MAPIAYRKNISGVLEPFESLCAMELEPSGTAVKLSVTHTIEREPSKFIEAVSGGWPKVISNLKSPLELAPRFWGPRPY